MKRIYAILIIFVAIASCNTKQSEKEEVKADSVIAPVIADSANLIKDSHYFWTADLDQKGVLVLKKDTPVSADSLTAAYMIGKLNEEYPEVQLEFNKITNDSIFVKIRKSTYLTQQMGSSGAEAYLAEVTYNLSELKDISFVDIRFKEGDHAAPGTYTRTDFVHTKN